MNIIIYNINSVGGNHEYSQAISNAYQQNQEVSKVTLLMPVNSPAKGTEVERLLMTDIPPFQNNILRKLHFVYRSIVNPLRLARYLKKQDPSVVIFNDFDQLTAPLWYRWFLKLKSKHVFAVILHDPDRDKYLPLVSLSEWSMNDVMRIMDVGFYHGYLPQKVYYNNNCIYAEIPHGIYAPIEPDQAFSQLISQQKRCKTIIGIIGNIRDEKNYDFIIEALPRLPDCQLLVAGSRSSANVPIERYKQKIIDLKLQDRVIWIERFLTEAELNTAIAFCDILLLYYKVSFTSQSGILNAIAPYQKKLLITNTPSALQQVVAEHNLGVLVAPDNQPEFIEAINKLSGMDKSEFSAGWLSYIKTASWNKNVAISIKAFKQIKSI